MYLRRRPNAEVQRYSFELRPRQQLRDVRESFAVGRVDNPEGFTAFMVNDSGYGLAGAVWTSDINRARVAHAVETGRMWVNTSTKRLSGCSDPVEPH